MLRLMDIQQVLEHERGRDRIYQVTLERDGETRRYDFVWHPRPESRPGLPDLVNEPMDVLKDLLDYQEFASPGQPQGVFDIPPLRAIIQYVFKAADGKSLDFPIVLDER